MKERGNKNNERKWFVYFMGAIFLQRDLNCFAEKMHFLAENLKTF